ncbi:DUF4037 domain-containing protein [Chloroflexota bacterium]
MPRPHVQISAPNRINDFRAHVKSQLPRLTALPGVSGIMLNGGLSRGFADDLSEIDLTFYLESATYTTWKMGRSPLPIGICVLDGMIYDIKSADLDEEMAHDWEMVALWDLSYAEILYDPHGALARLKADKLIPIDPLLATSPLFAAWWHFELAGNAWIKRADALQGHLILNQAVVELLKALFLANGEYVPHDKWLLHLSRSLDWQPNQWDARLTQAMTSAPVMSSVQMRQKAIAGLWQDIDIYLVDAFYPDFPLNMTHYDLYDQLMRLVEVGQMTTAEWQREASLEMLSQSPLHEVVTVADGLVRLNRERFLSLDPEEMYEWHYAILDAARGETL